MVAQGGRLVAAEPLERRVAVAAPAAVAVAVAVASGASGVESLDITAAVPPRATIPDAAPTAGAPAAASKSDAGWPRPVSEVTPPSPRPKADAEVLRAAQRSNR